MTWTDHIHADPRIAGGKPVIKGTRLAVDFILGLLTEGWSRDDLRTNYPHSPTTRSAPCLPTRLTPCTIRPCCRCIPGPRSEAVDG